MGRRIGDAGKRGRGMCGARQLRAVGAKRKSSS